MQLSWSLYVNTEISIWYRAYSCPVFKGLISHASWQQLPEPDCQTFEENCQEVLSVSVFFKLSRSFENKDKQEPNELYCLKIFSQCKVQMSELSLFRSVWKGSKYIWTEHFVDTLNKLAKSGAIDTGYVLMQMQLVLQLPYDAVKNNPSCSDYATWKYELLYFLF